MLNEPDPGLLQVTHIVTTTTSTTDVTITTLEPRATPPLSTKSLLMKPLRLEVKRPQDLQASPVAFVHDWAESWNTWPESSLTRVKMELVLVCRYFISFFSALQAECVQENHRLQRYFGFFFILFRQNRPLMKKWETRSETLNKFSIHCTECITIATQTLTFCSTVDQIRILFKLQHKNPVFLRCLLSLDCQLSSEGFESRSVWTWKTCSACRVWSMGLW